MFKGMFKFKFHEVCFYGSNRSISQIPQCTSPISHNAPFCKRNVHICAHFCYKMVHCGIFVWCIVGCVRWVYWQVSIGSGNSLLQQSQHAITWTDANLFPWRKYATLRCPTEPILIFLHGWIIWDAFLHWASVRRSQKTSGSYCCYPDDNSAVPL